MTREGYMRSSIHLAAVLLLVFSSISFAAEKPSYTPKSDTPDEIVRFVQRAVKHINTVGEEQAYRDFYNPEGPWLKGQWFLFVNSFQGVVVAHVSSNLVGRSLLGVRDVKGNAFYAELQSIAQSEKGRGWAKYWWPRADTTVPALKFSYIERVPGKELWIGTGTYELDEAEIDKLIETVQ